MPSQCMSWKEIFVYALPILAYFAHKIQKDKCRIIINRSSLHKTILVSISSSTNLCKSVISWRSDLLAEETGVPGENHLHDKLYHMLLYRVHLAWTDLIWFDFWCFNATFNNISAISWRPVLVVEEAGVLWENHRPLVNYHLRLRVECTLFCNLQSRARTHAVLVIGLYEMLDPAT